MEKIEFSKEEFTDLVHVKTKFNKFLFIYYENNKRNLVWREHISPYFVLISEFMLHQTQVNRVIPFFEKCISLFPTMESFAHASQADILSMWSGLGYNRRALYLQNAAKTLVLDFKSQIPQDINILKKIKGIGPYTASALLTYTHNVPTIFVETNIRTVCFILFEKYFNEEKIDDISILNLLNNLIDKDNPREWYYALMDLGTHLKLHYPKKHLQRSRSYQKQSPFKGSFRAIRGKIIKMLIKENQISRENMLIYCNDQRTEECIELLKKECFIEEHQGNLFLKK